jgi:hypothetical protein
MLRFNWLLAFATLTACGTLRETAIEDDPADAGQTPGGDDDDDDLGDDDTPDRDASTSEKDTGTHDTADADADAAVFVKGELEPIAANLVGGLGVATTDANVYWYEEGEFLSGSLEDAVLRSLPIGQTCSADIDCGNRLYTSRGEGTFFGDARTGPIAGDGWACVSSTVNATRDTEMQCVQESSGDTFQLASEQFAAGVGTIYDGHLYFTVPRNAADGAAGKSLIRSVALAAGAEPVTVIARAADDVLAVAADAGGMVWLEGGFDDAPSSLWMRTPSGEITQMAADRPGSGNVALDASHVYVTRIKEGMVVRYARTAPFAMEPLASTQGSPLTVARRGDFLFWFNLGAPPNYSASSVMRARPDGSEPVVLDSDTYLSGMAVTDTHVYVSQYTSSTIEARTGTIKRVRYVAP